MSLIVTPSMILFSSYGDNKHSVKPLDKIQISNMGFASPYCRDTSLAVGTLILDCPSGLISKIVNFGLSPKDAWIMDPCMPNSDIHSCDDAVHW